MRSASERNRESGGFDPNGRSISQIFQEMLSHVSEIFRSELKLARTEIRQDVGRVAKASVLLAAGAVLALYSIGILLLALVYALQTVVAAWLSAVIVGGALAVMSGALFMVGRSLWKKMNLRPEATIRSFEENLTWLKKQARS